MKRILWCAISVVFYISSFAQTDSTTANADTLTNMQADSIAARDNLRTNFPVSSPGDKQPVYKIKRSVDIPILAAGAVWSGYAFTKIYSKSHSTEDEILSLSKNNINGFDRWDVRPYSQSIDRFSFYPFYASTALPFLFLLGKETSHDFFKLCFLYLETMGITGLLYTGSVYFVDRYRPYAYSDQTSMDERLRGGAKNSFYAGHVALVATSTFFMAQAYADYHPDSKAKWVFYTLAGAATASMGYLRLAAGTHFPSDILLGAAQGTITGILIPHLHKNKGFNHPNLTIVPFGDGRSLGCSFFYHL
jgi:membrane-associated phospholipid phosphatase